MRTRAALFHPRKAKGLRQRQESQPKEGGANRNHPWNPDSLFRHDDGRRLRALYEKQSGKPGSTLPSGICRRGDGCCVDLEPANSRYRAISFDGNAFVLSRFCGILVRRAVPACFRPPDPPSACWQRTIRRPKKQTQSHHDDGAGGDAAQHPGGHGGWRYVRRLSCRKYPDHRSKCIGAVDWHRHSEFPRRRFEQKG